MFKRFTVSLFICLITLSTFAQIEKYAVPVKWERYKISIENLSVLLPKLPVLDKGFDRCSEQAVQRYATYAAQTIYGFTIISKNKDRIPGYCSEKTEFNEKSFPKRLKELKTELNEYKEEEVKQNNLIINKIAGKTITYLLINDFENKRWFEFWVIGGNDEKIEVQNFIKSIEISKNTEGIEIGNGATQTYGDDKNETNQPKNEETNAVNVAFKPMPRYTDEARKNDITGTITLKVVFLSNGGIGSITLVSGLPFGLTEQAIFAAQRLVFIPARRKGVPYSVSKTITYNFTVY